MLTSTEIKTKIAGIGTRTSNLRADIQALSVQIVLHAYIHGDVTLADKLMTAIRALDRTAWARWMTHNGPFILDKTTGNFKLNKERRKLFASNTEEEIVGELELAGNWWDSTPSAKSVARALDVASRILSVANSINKARDEGTDIKVDRDAIRSALVNLNLALTSLDRDAAAKAKAKAEAPNQFRRLSFAA
jgi:hypothetical protein